MCGRMFVPRNWADALAAWDAGEFDDDSLVLFADQRAPRMAYAARELVKRRRGR